MYSHTHLSEGVELRGDECASVFDFSGRFARDILEILKIGGTPHADREGEVQKHIGISTF